MERANMTAELKKLTIKITDNLEHCQKILLIFTAVSIVFYTSLFLCCLRQGGFTASWPGLTVLPLCALIIINIPLFLHLRLKRLKSAMKQEIEYTEFLEKASGKLFLLLDSYGAILRGNSSLSPILFADINSFVGKPVRDFIKTIAEEGDVDGLILDKLRESFEGKRTEFICQLKTDLVSGEKLNIHASLIPRLKNGTTSHILLTAKILDDDFISREWLNREDATYIVDSVFPGITLLSSRLTRNLIGKLPTNRVLQIRSALQEAITNAVEHGNLGIDFEKKAELKKKEGNYWENALNHSHAENAESKKVLVYYSLKDDKVTYTITDEGEGFDWKYFMDSPPGAFGEYAARNYHGMGLQIIKNTFDHVSFNDKGNQIVLIKYLEENRK